MIVNEEYVDRSTFAIDVDIMLTKEPKEKVKILLESCYIRFR